MSVIVISALPPVRAMMILEAAELVKASCSESLEPERNSVGSRASTWASRQSWTIPWQGVLSTS